MGDYELWHSRGVIEWMICCVSSAHSVQVHHSSWTGISPKGYRQAPSATNSPDHTRGVERSWCVPITPHCAEEHCATNCYLGSTLLVVPLRNRYAMCSYNARHHKGADLSSGLHKGPWNGTRNSKGTATGQYSTVALNIPLVLEHDA